MNAKNKNLIWGAIALLGLGALMMGGMPIPQSPQATQPPPQSETPGMIQWNR